MRLIDADGVTEQIKKNKLLAREPAAERCMEIIKNATTYVEPPVYDVDKVVEQMSDIGLKPCPFCGGRMLEITSMRDLEECGNFEHESCPCEQYEKPGNCGYITIVCNKNKGGCGTASGYYVTEGEAVEAWNRRISNE